MEGSRPLLVEVQGLASRSSYGMPIRSCNGFDKNRLTMLLAILEKKCGVSLATEDIFVNVVGGSISTSRRPTRDPFRRLEQRIGKPFPSGQWSSAKWGWRGKSRRLAVRTEIERSAETRIHVRRRAGKDVIRRARSGLRAGRNRPGSEKAFL